MHAKLGAIVTGVFFLCSFINVSAQLPYTYGLVNGYNRDETMFLNDSVIKTSDARSVWSRGMYYYYKFPSMELLKTSNDGDVYGKLIEKKPMEPVLWSYSKAPVYNYNGAPFVLSVTNKVTGDKYIIDTLTKDYYRFASGFCDNYKYYYYSSYDGVKFIDLATMEVVYALDYQAEEVSLSADEKTAFITYKDYQENRTNLVLQTGNWQLLTKINFNSFVWNTGNANRFYTKQEAGHGKILLVVWDIDKMYELAAENKLQSEYSPYEIAYVPSFEDRQRDLVFSPLGNYILMGNVLYNANTTACLGSLPTPDKFGMELAAKFSDDEKYIRVHLLKYQVDMAKLEIRMDTIDVKELKLPGLEPMPKGSLAGTYNEITDKGRNDFITTTLSKELQVDLMRPTQFPDWLYQRYSPGNNRLYAVRDTRKDKDLGYFTGKGDKFKSVSDLYTFSKKDKNELAYLIYAKYNKDMTRVVLVTQSRASGPEINVKLVDLEKEKVIKEHEKFTDLYADAYFSDDDLQYMYYMRSDTIYKTDFDGNVKSYVVANCLAPLLKEVKGAQYDKGSLWIKTAGPAYTLTKINVETGRTEAAFVWPEGVTKLFEFTQKEKAHNRAQAAKAEEEKVRSANKFDAKKYKQKIKQERKEANDRMLAQIYEAAAKNPVYESCGDCHGKGNNSSFNISYSRETSGSWGYSSNYSHITTYTTTSRKCSTCNGTGKAVCYRASCYNLSATTK